MHSLIDILPIEYIIIYMNYLLVSQIAKKWNISKRTVRNYCAKGKIDGAFLTGKKWNIPEDAKKPNRINKKYSKPKTLLEILQVEKKNKIAGGIYHKIQIDLTFNSNHIEGSKLTIEQTRYIFPKIVAKEIKKLIDWYNSLSLITFDDILDFHYKFEMIHPFQDGNGRVGRLIMFKECLKHNIVPFIIDDNLKLFYYRGLNEWKNEKGYLRDTCLTAQDKFKTWLDYFQIPYKN